MFSISRIIKNIMSSTAEIKLRALYISTLKAVYINLLLECMGHPQPSTLFPTDNSTSENVINSSVQPKCIKIIMMCFCWLHDCKTLKLFHFYWQPGLLNFANYWMRHQGTTHHHNMHPELLTPLQFVPGLRFFDCWKLVLLFDIFPPFL